MRNEPDSSPREPVHAARLASDDLAVARASSVMTLDASGTDPMGEAWSWSAFVERVTQAIERAEHASRRIVVLHVELHVVDTDQNQLEPGLADRVLPVAAACLRRNLRSTDSSIRLGRGELGLIIESGVTVDSSQKLAKRVLAAGTGPMAVGQLRTTVGGNIGLAIYPDVADLADRLLANTAKALADAKATDIDTIRMATPSS